MLLALTPLQLKAQLESAHWYFGANAGLDFTSGEPEVVFDGVLNTGEGCASIADPNGNLLFYTDGSYVYNREHNMMTNGFGLLGNPSSTQSAIIVPYPGQLNLYYIFTVGADDTANPDWGTSNTGFNYYLVDMSLEGGLGAVLPYDNDENNLMPLTSEKVTAVSHGNNNDFWVITHFEDKFYAYLVTTEGLNTTPIISQIGPYLDPLVYPVTSRGYLKTSPNGEKIAVAHLSYLMLEDIPQSIKDTEFYYTNGLFANGYNGYSAIYDFDDETGQISNEVVLSEEGSPYGVEFSYSSDFLYVEYDYHYQYPDAAYGVWINGELIQYDLNSADIVASASIIYDDYQDLGQIFHARGALQLALDKKIYYAPSVYTGTSYHGNYLSVIHAPDLPGTGSDFEFDAIRVNNEDNPYHYVAFGLPPFITSFFNATINFEGEIMNSGTCLGNSVSFSIQSNYEISGILWDFGDGNTSTELSPTHIYSSSGTYTITAYVDVVSDTETITRDITIHPLPEVQNAELIECDYNEDGLALFTLSEADAFITSAENSISYHLSYEDAENHTNPLPAIYPNTSPNQVIFARVSSPNQCISIAEIILSVNQQEVKWAEGQALCDLESDGIETFPLTESIPGIESLFGETVTVLSFHDSVYKAEMDLNPLNLNHQNTSNPQTVYARVETSGCTEIVSFQLSLYPLPVINIPDAEICPDYGVWGFDAGNGYVTYEWTGLQGDDQFQPTDQSTISITNAGNYSLILENEFGCTYEEHFSISVKELPLITEVVVSGDGVATVTVEGDGPFEYSLDGVLWQSSNKFHNLLPGDYDVYVRDKDNCISLKDGFGVLEIPNFISPNDDGYNDSWVIRGLTNYDDAHIQIFDRYGKIFVDKRNYNNSEVWDGKYLGRVINSGSYWYIITVSDGRKYVGTLAVRNY